MAGFALDISGVKQISDAIKKMEKAATDGISQEMETAAINIQKAAKRKAPGNFGALKKSINVDIGSGLFKSVYSPLNYAPYVEFGTRGKVKIPPGYEGFAAQFKGKSGGTLKDLYEAILLYVKRKKIAQIHNTYTGRRSTKQKDVEFAAKWISWLIIKNGVKPQPYLIPSYEEEKPKLIKRLKNLFK